MKKKTSLFVAGLLVFCLAGCDFDKIDMTNMQTIDFALSIPRSLKLLPLPFDRVDSSRHRPTYTNNDAVCIPGSPACE